MELGSVESFSVAPCFGVPGVEIVARLTGRRGQMERFNDTYTLCLLESSNSTIHFKGRSHQAHDGALGLLEPGELFRILRTPTAETYDSILVSPPAVEEAATELGLKRSRLSFKSPIQDHGGVYRAFRRFAEVVRGDSSPLERQERFASALRLLLEGTFVATPRVRSEERATTAVKRCRDLLHDRFQEGVTLDELAGAAGLSKYHLLRSFSAVEGVTPHQYLMHLRIREAQRLLERGRAPAEVAASLGFVDQSHLTRCFRREIGVPPGVYQRGVRRDHAQ
jgi:AraC-like DNA-binding protein